MFCASTEADIPPGQWVVRREQSPARSTGHQTRHGIPGETHFLPRVKGILAYWKNGLLCLTGICYSIF